MTDSNDPSGSTGSTGSTGMERLRSSSLARAVLLVVVFLALSAGVAAAFWTAGSAPGGNGAAAATQLDRGATPTATRGAQTGTVTVAWTASTSASGQAVSGYQGSAIPPASRPPRPHSPAAQARSLR